MPGEDGAAGARFNGCGRVASRRGPSRRRLATVALALMVAGLSLPAAAPGQSGEAVRVLAFGTSLTAGYGLAPEDGFTVRLEEALTAEGYDVSVLNAGVSGDTTAGGLARLDWALADRPDAVIVELGSNDGLRGIDPAVTRANLDAILATLTDHDLPVLFTGMYAPPNMGEAYATAFDSLFPELAEEYGVLFYPFFLKDVATVASLNQADAIHPNPEGVQKIVDNILPDVRRLLASVETGDQR